MKRIVFLGDALDQVRSFPEGARKEAGGQLHKVQVQQGLEPSDWKPMGTVGSGVREIRIREDGGAFRVLYVAQFAETVVVLHAFEKKAQKTPGRDLDLADDRLRAFTTININTKEKKR
ncbi:type II toxin-antitoxin system RelE/ParE family toxin [Jannaschia marina]|uniref:type II toxin-antitoxin system RelE/ParE family toxin n=1 Tax=Jannaschia marina TaxID=2741674 RepID=UPI0015C84450|nr:type II toxin-antitoxin system RelE/ParE family toxin [Jannaschia marina]